MLRAFGSERSIPTPHPGMEFSAFSQVNEDAEVEQIVYPERYDAWLGIFS
jgi:hypothetical protein